MRADENSSDSSCCYETGDDWTAHDEEHPAKGNLPENKFLDTEPVVDFLKKTETCLEHIPQRLMENVFLMSIIMQIMIRKKLIQQD